MLIVRYPHHLTDRELAFYDVDSLCFIHPFADNVLPALEPMKSKSKAGECRDDA